MKGSKRVKAEVAVKHATSENENQTEGISKEAYELMIKGNANCLCFSHLFLMLSKGPTEV